MVKVLEAFVDESCHTQHRYLVLGGIACEKTDVVDCERRFGLVRKTHNMFGEVKWTKISNAKSSAYIALLDAFFNMMDEGKLSFHCLIADTSTFNNRKYNAGSREIGFNKLIYQLLLKFGRLYGDAYRMYVYLDGRTTRASLIELRTIVNHGLAKRWDVRGWPVRRLDFRDSTSSDLFQLNDVLIGAIGHRKNGHHLVPDASPAKKAVAEHLARRSGLADICRNTRLDDTVFTVWNFQYGK